MGIDFRTAAAEATLNKLRSVGGQSLADLDESGCILVPGGTRLRYLAEVPSFLTIIGCWISFLVAIALAMLKVISEQQALIIILAGFALALVFRKLRSLLMKSFLSCRADGFVKGFRGLESRPVAIEEGKTVQKIKFITEDEGVCLLDAGRQRLLIEGCSYRYLIYAKDVFSIDPISGYALSGARVVCRMGQEQIDMVLKSAGQGPLASLVQAFAPQTQAAGLATVLNRTLFGADAPAYRQTALPPPLPK
jgi:hypothetical protein